MRGEFHRRHLRCESRNRLCPGRSLVDAKANRRPRSNDYVILVVADHVSRTDDKITIPGWISFQQTTRAPRTGRNPRTGETIQIKASKTPGFKAGKGLKDAIN